MISLKILGSKAFNKLQGWNMGRSDGGLYGDIDFMAFRDYCINNALKLN